MKILFLGDASMVHYNLSQGLREMGHKTMVVSSGLRWRGFPQDIRLERGKSRWAAFKYVLRLLRLLPSLRGYDVVQIVGPNFLDLKKSRLRLIYDYLRRHNRRIVMTALGDDYYWAHVSCDIRPFRYGDFNIGDTDRRLTFPFAQHTYEEWTSSPHKEYCQYVAETCDLIMPVLYEYWECYRRYFPNKTHYLPLPVIPAEVPEEHFEMRSKVRIFIGIQKFRSKYKGTDIMLKAAQDIVSAYPDRAELQIVENMPYKDYVKAMSESDIVLDQLYGYSPAMNALITMSLGIVSVGGGEPECYDLLNEKELRPIVNVWPTYECVYHELEQLILHPEHIPELKRQSMEYVNRHHDYRKVAKRYLQLLNT